MEIHLLVKHFNVLMFTCWHFETILLHFYSRLVEAILEIYVVFYTNLNHTILFNTHTHVHSVSPPPIDWIF